MNYLQLGEEVPEVPHSLYYSPMMSSAALIQSIHAPRICFEIQMHLHQGPHY